MQEIKRDTLIFKSPCGINVLLQRQNCALAVISPYRILNKPVVVTFWCLLSANWLTNLRWKSTYWVWNDLEGSCTMRVASFNVSDKSLHFKGSTAARIFIWVPKAISCSKGSLFRQTSPGLEVWWLLDQRRWLKGWWFSTSLSLKSSLACNYYCIPCICVCKVLFWCHKSSTVT